MKFKISTALIYSLYILMNFIVMVSIYLISIYTGNDGIGINLLGGGDDGGYYYEQAVKYKLNQETNFTNIHPHILGILLKLFNTESILFLRLINFLPIILIPLLIYLLMENKKRFPFILILLCFYPTYIYYLNLSLYRDGWIIVFYLLSLICFSLMIKYFQISTLIIFIFSLIILYEYRDYAALTILLSSLIFLFIKKSTSNFLMKFIILSLIIFSLYYTFFKNLNLPIVNMTLNSALDYRLLAQTVFQGGSQFYINLSNLSILNFYINFIHSFYLNIYGPSILTITSNLSYLIAFCTESLLFMLMTYVLIKKFKYMSSQHKLLIISSVIWFLLISIINDNLGTALRLRMIGWIPIYVVFVELVNIRRKVN